MSAGDTSRLRMFAGPNGSGKSTIKVELPPELLGVYVNPDDLLREVQAQGVLSFEAFGVSPPASEIRSFFRASGLLEKTDLLGSVEALRFEKGKVGFGNVSPNAYFASVAADLIRRKLVEAGTSFTFETVMSSPDKVEFLEMAQAAGFRTYLYYVATEDPAINVNRVANRVEMGGHSVPEDKIISRYGRSLDLLIDALRFTDRAYLFDNSGRAPVWLAEVTDGRTLEMKANRMPGWFTRAVWDKMQPPTS